MYVLSPEKKKACLLHRARREVDTIWVDAIQWSPSGDEVVLRRGFLPPTNGRTSADFAGKMERQIALLIDLDGVSFRLLGHGRSDKPVRVDRKHHGSSQRTCHWWVRFRVEVALT